MLVLTFATFVEKAMILVNAISFLLGCLLCAIFIVLFACFGIVGLLRDLLTPPTWPVMFGFTLEAKCYC